MAAAADPIKRIQEQATCSICRDLFRHPVTSACGHSFCRECIAQIFQGREAVFCPQCRRRLQERDLRPNRDLKNIAEILRSQAAGKPEEWNLCERHRQPLQLYCKEDQTPICLVCMQAWAHRSHTVVPLEEALQEYREKMAEQLGVIESSCGKLDQFVSEVWKHLPENEQDEECQNLARVSEKLRVLKLRAESSRKMSADPASQTQSWLSLESDSPWRDVSERTERQGHSGREPGSETAAESREETGSQVGEETPTPKPGLSQGSQDDTIHSISSTRGDAEPKVDAQQMENRAEDCPSWTPAEESGGSRTDATPASSEQEGAAVGGRTEAAREGQQHPGSKAAKKKKGKNKKRR